MAQTHDTSFAPPTISGSTYSIRIGAQSDGKLLVRLESGSIGTATDNGLYRLNVDGSLDETWVGQYHWRRDGLPYPPDGFLVLPDDRVLVWSKEGDVPRPDAPTRNSVRLVRLLPDGELDTTFPVVDMFRPLFDSDGHTRIALDADGNYLITRHIAQIAHDEGPDLYPERDNDFGQLARMYPDGTLDLTTHVVTLVSGIYFGLPLADGRILVVGSGITPGIYVDGVDVDPLLRGRAILNHDFSYDSTFNGKSTFDGFTRAATDALQLSNGQLAIFGPFQMYEWGGGSFLRSLARVNLAGTRIQWPNTSPSGYWNVVSYRWSNTYTTGVPYGHLVQDYKGRVYAAARGTPVRLKLDGTEDTDWDHLMHLGSSNPPVDTPWQARMALDSTHTKLYIAGGSDLTQVAGVPSERIVRFDVDTFDGLGTGSIVLMATEGEDPDPDPDPDPDAEIAIVSDSIVAAGGAESLYASIARAVAALGGAPGPVYEGTAEISATIAIGDDPAWTIFKLVDETLVLSADGTPDFTALMRVVERLLLGGQASHFAEAVALVTDAMVLRALADAFAIGVAADTLLMSEHIASVYEQVAAVLERVLLSGSPAPSYTAMIVVREDVVLSGAGAPTEMELAALVREAVGFAANLTFDNGEYVAWVMNTESKGLSRYTQYPFNSFAKIGGRYMGCAPDGLYWLDGGDDDGTPIPAKIRLGMDNLGSRRIKHMPECYIGYTSDGVLLLKAVFSNEEGGLNMAIYRLKPRAAATLREHRFELGRGLKAVDWDFDIENVDGADFDLRSVEFHVLNTARRTRG